MNTFSISEALSFGWDTFKKNVSFFIMLVLALFLANIVVSFVFGTIFGEDSVAGFIGQVISIILSMLVSIGAMKITLDFVDGKKGDLKDLYLQYPLALKYIGVSILQGLIVLAGFILLIIPGIYLSVKLSFASYVVVDKKAGPVDAIKASYNMTKGNWWNLAFLGIVSVLITIAGALALLVGLFVAIPVVMLAYAYVYRKLSGGMGVVPAPVAPVVPEPVAPLEPAAPVMPQS